MFGDSFGDPKITKLMVEHPIAKEIYSSKEIELTRRYGHIAIKLFGYPFSVTTRQRARLIIKYLEPKKGEKILDVGCGVGYYPFELAKKYGCKAYGIDLDINDINLATKISKAMNVSNVSFAQENGLDLSFKEETFDKIILSEVIEHIYHEEEILKELWRVLKPNGCLIISTPYAQQTHNFSEQKSKIYTNSDKKIEGGHVREGYDLERINELLKSTNFEVIDYSYAIKKLSKNSSVFMFPIIYSISMFDDLLPGKGECIIVKAKKKDTK